jgi:hypothetical protein
MAWARLHGSEPPPRLSRDLMIRAIAYKVQEQAHGGLSPATRRRLRALTAVVEVKRAGVFDPGISLKPGAKLVREWSGRVHSVTVLTDGFDYEGRHHLSLTGIARLITGAHWSGPRFFGIGKAAPRTVASGESAND